MRMKKVLILISWLLHWIYTVFKRGCGSYVHSVLIRSNIVYCLSHDVASGSDITPCNKIDKPLVVYRFSNVMMCIITLRKRLQYHDVFTTRIRFLSNFNVI